MKRAGKGQAKGRQRATTKEYNTITSNNIIKEGEELINSRKQVFYNSLIPFAENYSKEMLRDFYEYWTEHGEKDKKMRFEKETSFGISRRLSTWKNKNFNNGQEKQQQLTAITGALRQIDPTI